MTFSSGRRGPIKNWYCVAYSAKEYRGCTSNFVRGRTGGVDVWEWRWLAAMVAAAAAAVAAAAGGGE